MNYLSSIAAYS